MLSIWSKISRGYHDDMDIPCNNRGSEYLLRSGAVEKNRGKGWGGWSLDGVVEGFLVCFLAYLRDLMDLPYSLSSSFELMVGFDECGPH